MSTTAQRALRLAVQTILGTYTGISVQSPGDWETQPVDLPSIRLRSPGCSKVSIAKQGSGFTSTVTLEILARVSAATAEDAQDALEALCGQIEDSVMALPELLTMLQQIAAVQCDTSVLADGAVHVGEARMTLQCETFETFDPVDVYGSRYVALQQLMLTLDLTNVFDATGTYATPPFPAAVNAAPRQKGPDGRAEATASIIIP